MSEPTIKHELETDNLKIEYRKSNESDNMNKSKRYKFLTGASMPKKADGYLPTNTSATNYCKYKSLPGNEKRWYNRLCEANKTWFYSGPVHLQCWYK